MNIILFDSEDLRKQLKPFTLTRPISELRTGVLTITEKWKCFFPDSSVSVQSSIYIMEKYQLVHDDDNVFINGAILPNAQLVDEISTIDQREGLVQDGEIIAFRSSSFMSMYEVKTKVIKSPFVRVNRPWDLVKHNSQEIIHDVKLLGLKSTGYTANNTNVYGNEIYVGQNCVIRNAVLNASMGPIVIEDNVQVNEFAVIHGPVVIKKGSVISIGARIRNNVSIGENCVVGGEVKDSIILNNSNKAHEGYLGNSVVGEWCNFGAGTNVSNLKNTLSSVRVWDFARHEFIDSGQQKLGLIMGDYSMTAVGTNFMTGSTVGVSANIVEAPKKYTPSFTWSSQEKYNFDKVVKKSQEFARLKGRELSDAEILILEYICTF